MLWFGQKPLQYPAIALVGVSQDRSQLLKEYW